MTSKGSGDRPRADPGDARTGPGTTPGEERLLGRLGPYFAVVTHRAADTPAEGWLPWSVLADGTSGVLESRVDRVRSALGASAGRPAAGVDPKVAASVAHLGLVARVIAPLLALAALRAPGSGGDTRTAAIAPDPRTTWWRDELGGPFPLSLPGGPGRSGPLPRSLPGGPGYSGPVQLLLLDALVTPLTEAVASRYAAPSAVLWGNVASAVNSAARLAAGSEPDLADALFAEAYALLDHPRLAAERGPLGEVFRRASCCQIHRLSDRPGEAVCGDCVLSARPPAAGP